MDCAIIYIHFRNIQPPISLKINAASLIRNTLAIIITNLLKQQDLTFSSNIFYGSFNADFIAAKASLVFISSSGNGSSCSRSGGGRGSGCDSTSTCGSSTSKNLSWTGKCKLGAIGGVRVGKYNLGTRAGKCKVSVRVGKHKLGAKAGRYKLRAQVRAGKYKFRARAGKYKLGVRVGKYRLRARTGRYKLGPRAGKYKLGASAGKRKFGVKVGVREIQRLHSNIFCYSNIKCHSIFNYWSVGFSVPPSIRHFSRDCVNSFFFVLHGGR